MGAKSFPSTTPARKMRLKKKQTKVHLLSTVVVTEAQQDSITTALELAVQVQSPSHSTVSAQNSPDSPSGGILTKTCKDRNFMQMLPLSSPWLAGSPTRFTLFSTSTFSQLQGFLEQLITSRYCFPSSLRLHTEPE